MIDRVALVFDRDLGNLFLLDSVLVHVPPHLQREYPEQGCPEGSFKYLVEYAPESILRMRMQRRHFLLSNTEARIVESRGDVPPATNRSEDSCTASNVDALVGLSDCSHS